MEGPIAAQVRARVSLARWGRLLVQERARWQLLTPEGRHIAFGGLGYSDVVLDPGNRLFYLAAKSGFIAAKHLETGQDEFDAFTQFGDMFRRIYLTRRSGKLFTVGVERPIDPHAHVPPSRGSVEVQSLGSPLQLDANRILQSSETVGLLNYETIDLAAAMHQDTMVVASPNRIELAGANLDVSTVIEGEFVPRWLSLDETGRIYLVAVKGGISAFWVITPAGERLVALDLPAQEIVLIPPIVGYDHSAFLLFTSRILAVNPEGNISWDYSAPNPVAGAAALPDGRLLVCVGPEIISFNAAGQSTTLHALGEPLATPPVLTDKGELLVASASNVFCLAPDPRGRH